MKITYYLYFSLLITLLYSCSSDDSNNEETEVETDTFSVSIEISKDTFMVDDVITFAVLSDQDIGIIDISKDDWNSSIGLISPIDESLGKSIPVFLSFQELGKKVINVRVQNEDGIKIEKSVEIEITRGDAVQLKGVKLKSFKNMDGTWDSEFSDNDPNRLADLLFAINKRYIPFSFRELESDFFLKFRFKSEVLMNQGDLQWDLTNENLYFNPSLRLGISFADDDGNGIVEPIISSFPYQIEFDLDNYISDKPEFITLKDQNGDLEMELELGW